MITFKSPGLAARGVNGHIVHNTRDKSNQSGDRPQGHADTDKRTGTGNRGRPTGMGHRTNLQGQPVGTGPVICNYVCIYVFMY